MDFLLVKIEHFSLGVMVEALRVNIDWNLEVAVFEHSGSLWSEISGRRGRPPPTICARLDRPVA